MKTKHLVLCLLLLAPSLRGKSQENVLQLSLKEAISLAQAQSVDAAVALNELKTAYWEYRTHTADQLPEATFSGTLPTFQDSYIHYLDADGTYRYVRSSYYGASGKLSIDQNIALTGGKISLATSLDFTLQLGESAYTEFMSIPFSVTLTQPIFGVNNHKWRRRIEPVRYREAKAAYIESVEAITITAISHFFNLLYAKENLSVCRQNLENANKLCDIATAKRKIGHISEGELMQLQLSALQAKGLLTEAESNHRANMFQLRSFLGLNEDDVLDPLPPHQAPSRRMLYQEVLEKAQANNAFAQNILRRQLQADYDVATAKGNRRNINIFASVGYTGKEGSPRQAYQNLAGNMIVEAGISIPLLDWGKRRGKVKVAESNREVVLSRTRQEQMNFNQNIFLLVENFNNQASQLEIASQADEIAEKRYKTAIETFLIGKINILDLNDAQKSKDEARLKHIRESYNYWNFYYRIRSLTLYDFMNNSNLDADFEEIIRR